jgi:hypothetical protein
VGKAQAIEDIPQQRNVRDAVIDDQQPRFRV